jgi:hypothetical protein
MNDNRLAYTKKLKMAKWLFAIGVLLFVAKPFVGYSINPSISLSKGSILVKSFTKRKHDYVENSAQDAKTIQKRLADPVNQLFLLLFLLFSCLLGIFSALTIATAFNITTGFLQKIKRNLFSSPEAWLLDGQLII